jgi:cob(I)alamin adenosyltransferase
VEAIHLGDEFLQAEMIRKTERAAPERSEARPHHHSEISVLERADDFLFETTRGFINHEKHEAIAKILGREVLAAFKPPSL